MPRYTALLEQDVAVVNVEGVVADAVMECAAHPKNPDVGMKKVRFGGN